MARVLMLEDSYELGETVMGALQVRGHDVTWAKTVQQAKACYGDGTYFDVLLCDYELPDGTGLDFLATVKDFPRQTTILWSGLDRTKEAAAAGVKPDHITTKVWMTEVFDLIEAA